MICSIYVHKQNYTYLLSVLLS